MQYLSQDHLFGKERALKLIVDAGTGTTAVGLGLGIFCLGCVLVELYTLVVGNISHCEAIAFLLPVQAPMEDHCSDAG